MPDSIPTGKSLALKGSSWDSTTRRPSSAPFRNKSLGLIDTLIGFADPGSRRALAQRAAHSLGGSDLLIFCRDAEVAVLLPAPGFPKTLQGGLQWQTFVAEC